MKYICGRCYRKLLKLLAQKSGLALPIVLAVLALGAITIAPFLTYANTSLVSSQSYRKIINETYSAATVVINNGLSTVISRVIDR
jgi:sulfite exporter TauE/SafE